MALPIFSNEAFRNFCLSKDPNEEYDYDDCYACAVAQYGGFLGIGQQIWYYGSGSDPDAAVNRLNMFASLEPHTFGALAERLKRNSWYD